MARLGDAIRRSQRIQSAPMGFGATKQQPRPSLVVCAFGPADEAAAAAAESGAEVAVLDGREKALSGEAVKRAGAAAANSILGGFFGQLPAEIVGEAKAAGLDFAVFDPNATLAAALLDEDVGYIAALTAQADEAYLRSLEALNLESIFLPDLPLPLSVSDQLLMSRASQLARKPLTCEVPADISLDDLRALRSAGVRVLLVAGGAQAVKGVMDRVAEMPLVKGERQDRPLVSLPTGRGDLDHEDDEDD